MVLAVAIYDKTLGGSQRIVRELRLVSQRMSARGIIELRVDAEIAAFNAQAEKSIAQHNSMLVIPIFVEVALTGRKNYGSARDIEGRGIDREKQIETVLEAFTANKLLMFVDSKQITELEQQVAFAERSTVTFIKLVPLVGG